MGVIATIGPKRIGSHNMTLCQRCLSTVLMERKPIFRSATFTFDKMWKRTMAFEAIVDWFSSSISRELANTSAGLILGLCWPAVAHYQPGTRYLQSPCSLQVQIFAFAISGASCRLSLNGKGITLFLEGLRTVSLPQATGLQVASVSTAADAAISWAWIFPCYFRLLRRKMRK